MQLKIKASLVVQQLWRLVWLKRGKRRRISGFLNKPTSSGLAETSGRDSIVGGSKLNDPPLSFAWSEEPNVRAGGARSIHSAKHR